MAAMGRAPAAQRRRPGPGPAGAAPARPQPLLLLGLQLLALLAAAAGAAAARDALSMPGDASLERQGRRLQQLAGFPSGYSSNGVTYNGGLVLSKQSKVRIIWYGTWTATQKDIIQRFIANMGGSKLQTTQDGYGDTFGNYTRGGVQLTTSITLTSLSYGSNLDQSTVGQMVADALSATTLVYDGIDDIFLVLSGPDVTHADFCTATCGWHAVKQGTPAYHYAWVGHLQSCQLNFPGSPCLAQYQDPSPNGEPGVDAMIPLIANQIWGTQINPRANGWGNATLDAPDLCVGNPVASRPLPTGPARWNAAIGDRHYYTQSNWVNNNGGGCALTGTRFNTGWRLVQELPDLFIGSSPNLACPATGAMSLFRFQNDPSGTSGPNLKATWWFNCPSIDPKRLSSPVAQVQTALIALLTGAVTDLAALPPVACPDLTLLQSWRLFGPTLSQFQVSYSCVPVTGVVTCGPKWTPWTSDYEGSLRALNFHEPHCPKDSFLKGWQVVTNAAKLRIEYTCCQLS